MFFRIDDPKKREQIVNELLKNRSIIKKNFEKERQQDMGYREESEKLFKPITETISEQNTTQKENMTNMIYKIDDNKKFLSRTQNVIYNKLSEVLPSILIRSYLIDDKSKSKAIYSIRYNPENNQYSIGDSFIKFDNNFMEIAGKKYNATDGLMELLTKIEPHLESVTDEDIENYKKILKNTNGIYQNVDPNAKFASDRSAKWVIISKKLSKDWRKTVFKDWRKTR